jgi:hypothetical protein
MILVLFLPACVSKMITVLPSAEQREPFYIFIGFKNNRRGQDVIMQRMEHIGIIHQPAFIQVHVRRLRKNKRKRGFHISFD